MNFNLAIVEEFAMSKKDSDVAYATLLCGKVGGFGKVRVTLLGVKAETLTILGRLPYNISADVEFSVYGAGQDAKNNLTLKNVHFEDILGIGNLAEQIALADISGGNGKVRTKQAAEPK